MRMGERQVHLPVRKSKKESIDHSLFKRDKEPVIRESQPDTSTKAIFGIPVGPPIKEKLAALSDDEYKYLKKMRPEERASANLGRRTDPEFPARLRLYMARFPEQDQNPQSAMDKTAAICPWAAKLKSVMKKEAEKRRSSNDR